MPPPSSFLQGWTDSTLHFLDTFPQHVHLADTSGDGQNRLVTIQKGNCLMVYRGNQLEFEKKLKADQVVSVELLIGVNSYNRCARRKAIAVCLNWEVVIYDQYQPYFRLALPETPLAPAEIALYQEYFKSAGKESLSELVSELSSLRKEHYLSDCSDQLLSFEKNRNQQSIYMGAFNRDELLQQLSSTLVPQQIVASAAINKDSSKSIQQLLLATENKVLYLLNDSATSVQTETVLSHTPSSMFCLSWSHLEGTGRLERAFSVVVFTRSHFLLRLSPASDPSLTFQETVVSLESTPLHLVEQDKQVLISLDSNVVICLNSLFQKVWTVSLPCGISSLQSIQMKNQPDRGMVVAGSDQSLILFHGQEMVSKQTLPDQVAAMCFGTFGQEEASLLLCYRTKGVDLRILPRQFNFSSLMKEAKGAGENHVIPKKTMLYLQDVQREKEEFGSMHRQSQQDLLELRVTVAREYLSLVGGEENTGGFQEGVASQRVRVGVEIEGMGPKYLLRVSVENTQQKYLKDLYLAVWMDTSLYRFYKASQLTIPLLPPRKVGHYLLHVEHSDLALPPSSLRISLSQKAHIHPLINCHVQMPHPPPP